MTEEESDGEEEKKKWPGGEVAGWPRARSVDARERGCA